MLGENWNVWRLYRRLTVNADEGHMFKVKQAECIWSGGGPIDDVAKSFVWHRFAQFEGSLPLCCHVNRKINLVFNSGPGRDRCRLVLPPPVHISATIGHFSERVHEEWILNQFYTTLPRLPLPPPAPVPKLNQTFNNSLFHLAEPLIKCQFNTFYWPVICIAQPRAALTSPI